MNNSHSGMISLQCSCLCRSCYGNAIPDMLDDIQAVGNASLRALVSGVNRLASL